MLFLIFFEMYLLFSYFPPYTYYKEKFNKNQVILKKHKKNLKKIQK
nr:MAG TPA: hypothetical protein [Caudoviricetes sp.]